MRKIVSRISSWIRALPGRIRGYRPSRSALWSIAVLAVILASIMFFKVELSLARHRPTWDAAFYTDIAKHVRDGEGLTTEISHFHNGVRTFPHRVSIKPLWLLVYGYSMRILPLTVAAIWLPTLLYFLTLIFAYLWGSSLFPRELFPERFSGFNAGHVAVLMLGLHDHYFLVTSQPYTEALAFLLVFAMLWRGTRLWSRPSFLSGLELGVWIGLCMLTRRQLVLLAIAAMCAFAWSIVFTPKRRKYLVMLAGCVPAVVVLLGLHVLYLSGNDRQIVDYVGILDALKLRPLREDRILSPLARPVVPQGAWDYFLWFCADRWKGVILAFKLTGKHGYYRSFHLFQYAAFAVLPFLLVSVLEKVRRGGIRALRDWTSVSPGWIFLIALALGGFLSLHMVHRPELSKGWLFPLRHGLTAIFLFYLSLVYLLRHRTFPAVVIGVFILSCSTFFGFRALDRRVDEFQKHVEVAPEKYKRDLVGWLQSESDRRGELTVAMSEPGPQSIAYLTDNVHYHWIWRRTTSQDAERLIDTFGIDYLLIGSRPKKFAFAKDMKKFDRMFQRVGNRSGYIIFKPRPKWLEEHGIAVP